MRAVIQRVSEATVRIDNKIKSVIKNGLVVFVGVEDADTDEDIEWLSNKIVNLRIFDDKNNPDVNRHPDISVKDIDGDILAVSQFTLQAAVKKGNRPSYIKASKAEIAIPLYEKFITRLSRDLGKAIQTGEFGADMKVQLVNDGPVTLWINTKHRE